VRRNQNGGVRDVALFEVGQVFLNDRPEGQHTYATAVRAGGTATDWQGGAALSVFDAKADLAATLDGLGHDLDKLQLVAEAPAWAHPGRGGRVQLGPTNVIGWFGEVHPGWVAEMDLSGPMVAFELDLDAIPEPRKKGGKSKGALKLSDLMPVERDFAFLLDRDVTAAALLKAARNADKALITDVSIFDLFEGKGVPEGKKSVAIRVTLQPVDHTLTDEEIEKVSGAIVAAVGKATGGVLRS
jgi:phenylalanyl-tRNA synthetase beta chain